MQIAGDYTFNLPRQKVWDLLQDPDILARTLPGVERFAQVGPHEYEAAVRMGVAAVRGAYQGRVRLANLRPPERYTLVVSGQGSGGTIEATAEITLVDQGERTQLRYTADAQIGGAVGGVGQRLLSGVATLLAQQFFKAIEEQATAAALSVVPTQPAAGERAGAPGSPGAGAAGLLELVNAAGVPTPALAAGAVGLALVLLWGRRGQRIEAHHRGSDAELAAAIRDLARAIREQKWAGG